MQVLFVQYNVRVLAVFVLGMFFSGLLQGYY